MIPGELIAQTGDIDINQGRKKLKITVELVEVDGNKIIYGFNARIMGKVDKS